MRSVKIRTRCDGVTELAPRLAPLAARHRAIVIATVFLVTGALYLGGVVRPAIAGIVAFACALGEVILDVRAALARLRPAAEVHEVPHFKRAG